MGYVDLCLEGIRTVSIRGHDILLSASGRPWPLLTAGSPQSIASLLTFLSVYLTLSSNSSLLQRNYISRKTSESSYNVSSVPSNHTAASSLSALPQMASLFATLVPLSYFYTPSYSLHLLDMDLCCLIDSGERLNASDLVTMLGDLLERGPSYPLLQTPFLTLPPETRFHVKPLPHARIPIVKLSLDPSPGLPSGIACDIGFENRLAIENTRLLFTYAKIDPTRVRTLVLFRKYPNDDHPMRVF